MRIGIQAAMGEPIGLTTLAALEERGFQLLRIQAYQDDPPHFTQLPAEDTTALVQEVLDAGLRPLVMIRAAEQILHLPEGVDVEFGNEPDLKAAFGWPDANLWVAETMKAIPVAEGRNPLWIGVISNLHYKAFPYLQRLPWREIPGWVSCSVHRYPDGALGPVGHKRAGGFLGELLGRSTRDQEVETLRRIVGPTRRIGLSEIGYNLVDYTEAQTATHFAWEREFFERQGFDFACVFQLASGPDPRNREHQFGMRRFDGTWRDEIVEAWTGVPAPAAVNAAMPP